MNSIEQLSNFDSKVKDTFEKAISDAAVMLDKEFQQIVASFIDELNERYKRHCFIFCDSMGSKSIDCYHRVSKERLCWWSCDDGRFDENCTSISIGSLYRNLDDTQLHVEIDLFLKTLSKYECSVGATHYFSWDGKTQFDFVTDVLGAE